MNTEAAGQAYHRLTAYRHDRHWIIPADDERVLSNFLPLDDSRYPDEFKTYPDGLPRTALPADLSRPATGRSIDLVGLSRLLYLSTGVVRYRERDGGRPTHFRAAPSAGNRHPVELYVCACGIDGLGDGVWHYGPRDHTLVRIAPAPECAGPAIVLTGVPWRTCWKYAERGYRHVWWDAGTVVAQLYALAADHGHQVHVRLGFVDHEVARLVGADHEHELPLAVVNLAHQGPSPLATADAAVGDLGPTPVTFPLVAHTHGAGTFHTPADVERWSEPWAASSSEPLPVSVEDVILRRGSTRRFDQRAVPLDTLRATLRGFGRVPAWDAGAWPLTSHVVVHAVDGLSPGLYRWHDGPELVEDGDLRARARVLCGSEELAYDCAFLVLHSARVVDALARRGERGYRALQFAAGLASGGLYLSAFAHGLGCTGLAVTDTTVPTLLRPPADGLLAAAVGIPAYRSRRGGSRPGSPTRLRTD